MTETDEPTKVTGLTGLPKILEQLGLVAVVVVLLGWAMVTLKELASNWIEGQRADFREERNLYRDTQKETWKLHREEGEANRKTFREEGEANRKAIESLTIEARKNAQETRRVGDLLNQQTREIRKVGGITPEDDTK